ncbi:hypothetical protein [Neolewinella agarilytica]|uniref:Uncharacterized protein n=1 Tax=Neolewinella agarilytica TaxID=478744 RepID=A0A1H9KC74_9BACT|nr:hypothetical protein [Neolewinella agarilytica]SEQ96668.1 hypothetical protein SAMN05444359_12041 [Neolewinella agarilytica]
MRNRIAVWGRDAQEKRVLITIELQVSDNIVRIQTYPEKVISDEVYKLFMEKWRKGQEGEFPEPDRVIARELSVSEGLLPDDLKAEQTDMILRAQTEWHFHVLSDKLAQSYKSELAEIEDRIERAGEYSSDLWNQAKNFWQKVQGQLQDKTLLREQGNEIRKRVDVSFEKLKAMREKLNEQYKEESTKQVAKFSSMLEDVEKRIGEGTHLQKVFNDLREIQRKFHNVKFTREDRNAIYSRIDAAFKTVKEKRGQGGGNSNSGAAGRTQSRLDGLLKAMERMKSSMGRDQNDLKFERRRIEKTDGQLEKQIREAKVVMIESRLSSKQVKLDDMEKTKTMLENKIAQEKKKAEKRAQKDAERAAAEAAKAKIAADISTRDVSPEEKAKLEAAAAAIAAGKKKKGGRTKPEDRTPENVASMVAMSEIVGGETPAASPMAEKAGDVIASAITSVGDAAESVTEEGGLLDQAGSFIASAVEGISEKLEDITDTAKAVAQVAGEKLEAVADIAEDKLEDVMDAAGEKFEEAKEQVEASVEAAKDKAEEVAEAVENKVESVTDEVKEEISGEEE